MPVSLYETWSVVLFFWFSHCSSHRVQSSFSQTFCCCIPSAQTAFNIYSSVLPFQLVAVARHVFFAFGRGDSGKYI